MNACLNEDHTGEPRRWIIGCRRSRWALQPVGDEPYPLLPPRAVPYVPAQLVVVPRRHGGDARLEEEGAAAPPGPPPPPLPLLHAPLGDANQRARQERFQRAVSDR